MLEVASRRKHGWRPAVGEGWWVDAAPTTTKAITTTTSIASTTNSSISPIYRQTKNEILLHHRPILPRCIDSLFSPPPSSALFSWVSSPLLRAT
jgi:hypothetical protein